MLLKIAVAIDEPLIRERVLGFLLESNLQLSQVITDEIDLLNFTAEMPAHLILFHFQERKYKGLNQALAKLTKLNGHHLILLSDESRTIMDFCQKIDFYPTGFLSTLPTKDNFIKVIEGVYHQSKRQDHQNIFREIAAKIEVLNLSDQEYLKQLSQYVRNTRKDHSLTQEEFSKKTGVSLRQVQRIESGEGSIGLETLFLILR